MLVQRADADAAVAVDGAAAASLLEYLLATVNQDQWSASASPAELVMQTSCSQCAREKLLRQPDVVRSELMPVIMHRGASFAGD